MADLSELQASQSVKIAGAGPSSGIEDNWLDVDSNGNAHVISTSAGPVTPGTVASNSNLVGGQFNTALPTLTNTQQSAVQLDSSGRLIIRPLTSTDTVAVSNLPATVDTNYGTVGANTLRGAAQIGNATGAANFGQGATGAQTLRVSSNLSDGAGTALSSVLINSLQSLEVRQAAPGLDLNGTGTLTALNTTVAANTQGCSTVIFFISGSFSLNYLWEATADGTNWVSVFAYNINNDTSQASNNATSVSYSVACGGFQQVRMRCSQYTSGTATVNWNSSQGTNNDRIINSDTNPLSGTITTQDVATTSSVGANGQVIYAGTPTANSSNSYSVQSREAIAIETTGTWTGTLQVEVSMDSGVTWAVRPLHQTGTAFTQGTFTGNFIGAINIAGYTNFRVRSTAAMTGTAIVIIVESSNINTVYVGNPIRIVDDSGNYLTTSSSGAKRPLDVVLNAPTKTTYMAGTGTVTPPATPTDIITINGSGTKTIKILKIVLYSTQTASGANQFFLKRYSTANTAGTSTSITAQALDNTNAATTATIKKYTANPTLGTLTGTIDVAYINTPIVGGTIQTTHVWDFSGNQGQPLVLRGTADQVSINFNGAALPAGLTVAASIMFTEE